MYFLVEALEQFFSVHCTVFKDRANFTQTSTVKIFVLLGTPSTPSTQKFNGYTKTRQCLTTPPGQRADRTFDDVPRSKMPHVLTDPVNLWY